MGTQPCFTQYLNQIQLQKFRKLRLELTLMILAADEILQTIMLLYLSHTEPSSSPVTTFHYNESLILHLKHIQIQTLASTIDTGPVAFGANPQIR